MALSQEANLIIQGTHLTKGHTPLFVTTSLSPDKDLHVLGLELPSPHLLGGRKTGHLDSGS